MPEGELSHLDERGRMKMVDISGKSETRRRAVARGELLMGRQTLNLLLSGGVPKGDALAAARLAGIGGAKMAGHLIPLCHPLILTGTEVHLTPDEEGSRVLIEASVETVGRTGAEMEALTAVSLAGLTLYDMLKAVDKGMVLDRVRLVSKEGGRTGLYQREE